MPLKLLKRTSKQYNVVSKSTFVISVELLDNGIMECTMDTDSFGSDCLLNISQRLGLHQPEFFGLRYISRGVPPRQRWVDLQRPLKRQLEKYAEDFQLSLGVMFYVADVNLLKDEMTRYHYFLQLKSDVIDGKLNCSIDQAISLAAYSLQAEFGDYDQERHTIDYLRDFAILPKELTSNEAKYPDINLDALYEAIIKNYGSLMGFPPPLAEIYYIMVTQQLDGYGQTAFPAKDDSGNDILFCVSANGLVIRRRDWTHIAAFRFNDIKSLAGHKKLLIVQGTHAQRSIQFHFTDPEVVKYVKKICLLQSTFYKENLIRATNDNPTQNNNSSSTLSSTSLSISDRVDGQSRSPSVVNTRGATPDFVQSSPNAIYENQYAIQRNNNSITNTAINYGSSGHFQPNSDGFCNAMQLQQMSNNLGGHLHQQPFNVPNSMMQLPFQSSRDINEYGNRAQLSRSTTPLGSTYGSSGMTTNFNSTYGSNNVTNMAPNHNMDLQSLLPSYRSAPDYKTAVQLKYGPNVAAGVNINDMPNNILNNKGSQNANGSQSYYANQQEEEDEEPIYENEIVSQIHSIELRDSSEKPVAGSSRCNDAVNGSEQGRNQQQPICTFVLDDSKSYLCKPPPPYPGTAARTSTPSSEPHLMKNSDGTFTKLKPAMSNHSDILRQIEAQLQQCNPTHTPPGVVSSYATSSSSLEHPKNVGPSMVSSVILNSENLEMAAGGSDSRTEEQQITMGSINTSLQKQVDEYSSGSNNILSASGSTNSAQQLSLNSLQRVQDIKDKHNQIQRKQDMQKFHSKTKISVADLNSASIDPAIMKEFQTIPKTKPTPNLMTAMKKENSKRNRCPNILPYEDNLIRLAPTKQNPDGYINASPLEVTVSGREWKYIVAQLPLAGNIWQIWQLIWQTDAKIIAALERDSTALFYPLDASTSSSSSALNTMYFADFQIVDSKVDKNNTNSIAREVTLIYLPKKQQRKIWILPYEDEWKEDVPQHMEHFLCFLEEVNSIQRKVSDASKPLVVVCGNGSGRSGVLVLCDALIHSADAGYKLRCDTLLADLRTQRMLLITSPAQYAFVLHTLEKYLAQSRLI